MKDIYNYIQNCIDAHIHLFDHSGTILEYIKIPENVSQVVGFMDVDFENIEKYDEKSVIRYYSNFINQYYDDKRMILLATGKDCDTMIELYNRFPSVIKGFLARLSVIHITKITNYLTTILNGLRNYVNLTKINAYRYIFTGMFTMRRE